MADGPAILVTGGAGYIGSHCCRALDKAGFRPVVYDNLSTGHRSFVTDTLVVGDVADKATLARAFAEHGIVAVMHFAASSLVGESMTDPQKYYLNNLAGTLALLEVMRAANCNRLVFSSTGAVYGNADNKALPENYNCAPINPYGASKWMIERVLADYRGAYGLSSFALRYFNASGADVSGAIGELREIETHLIPRAMMALQGHLGDFAVFGDDYDTPDGTAIRDYVHVTDLADAHLRAVQWVMGQKAGRGRHDVFNLGSGTGHSVKQVVESIGQVVGRPVPHVYGARRPGDSPRLVGCIDKAQNQLGWTPQRGLQTQIEDTVRWRMSMRR